jgi:hypothetical protein
LTVAVFPHSDHPSWGNPADFYHQTYQFDVSSEAMAHGVLHMAGGWSREDHGY